MSVGLIMGGMLTQWLRCGATLAFLAVAVVLLAACVGIEARIELPLLALRVLLKRERFARGIKERPRQKPPRPHRALAADRH
jgi:hypothetical protein